MLADRTLPELTRDLVDQFGKLVSNEAKLAKAELAENVREFSAGLSRMVFAAALGAAAVTLGLFSLAYALAQQMPLWAAGLIAAALGGIGAYALFRSGKKALAPDTIALPKTTEQVSRDLRLVKEHVPS